MLSEARHATLYRECAQRITDAAVRDAWRHLVGLAAEDPHHSCSPQRQGARLELRFEDAQGVQPFACEVRADALLFCFRKPAFLRQHWSEADLAAQFGTLAENARGDLTVALRTVDDVRRLWPLLAPTVQRYLDGGTATTRIGYVNPNGQRCAGHRGVPGNDHLQMAYRMECGAPGCGHVYGANGSDVFQRKCPRCQGGAPGMVF